MVLWLVDAHNTYQAGLNVGSLAREGYSGLIVKATQGIDDYTAPVTFDCWITQAREAGMVPGAYHWLTDADPVRQVNHLLTRLVAVGGPESLLIGLDCEDSNSPASADTVRAWIREWSSQTGGHQLLFYSGKWWYDPFLDGFDVAQLGVKSWNSHYVSGSGYASVLYQSVPPEWWAPGYGGFDRSALLQFSDHGTAGGITAHVDVNAFDGTQGDLLALT